MTNDQRYSDFIEEVINDIKVSQNFMIAEGIHEGREQPIKLIHYDCYKLYQPCTHYYMEYYVVTKDVREFLMLGWSKASYGGFIEIRMEDIDRVLMVLEDKIGRCIR